MRCGGADQRRRPKEHRLKCSAEGIDGRTMSDRKIQSKHVTLADVARESGFSLWTVSIVLNEAPLSRHVAAQTKERIRRTALTLGYRPDAFARSLRSQRSHTIGVMIFDLSDPFCTLILRGIEPTLQPTSYLPIIMDAHNDRRQFESYLDIVMERRVEGLIVVANWLFEEGGLLMNLRETMDAFSAFDGGERLTANLLKSGAQFTAIIAFDDLTVLGAVRALRRAGRRVPEDCSAIGFDDVPPAMLSTPGITTIRQPMEEMGRLATEFVLDMFRGTAEEDAGRAHAAAGAGTAGFDPGVGLSRPSPDIRYRNSYY